MEQTRQSVTGPSAELNEGPGVADNNDDTRTLTTAIERNDSDSITPAPASEDVTRPKGLTREFSMRSQKVIDDMRQMVSEAFASRIDDLSFARPPIPRGTLPMMRTITEESASQPSLACTGVHRRSVRSQEIPQDHTRIPSALYSQARLDERIAAFDTILESEDTVQTSYRERLQKVRGEFVNLRSICCREDVIGALDMRNMDLEVQVACTAHSNVKWLTYALLHGDVDITRKRNLRDYLRYTEDMANPGPSANHHRTLQRLDHRAEQVRRWVEEDPARPTPTELVRRASVILENDVQATISFLQHLLLLRYQHGSCGSKDTYRWQLKALRLKPLGMYLEWKRTQDRQTAVLLAQYGSIHPVELDREYGGRVRRLLRNVSVDQEYVENRLIDLSNVWQWVSAYNAMANNGQWDELAAEFRADGKVFDDIYPGPCVYRCHATGTHEPNDKAKVYIGMIKLQGYFFREISPERYILTRNSARMKRTHQGEQERLRRAQRMGKEDARFKSRPIARIGAWLKETSKSLSFEFKTKLTSEFVTELATKLSFSLDRKRRDPVTFEELET
ncbi:MAG: hypothetical protein Q9218_002216 [Villophora microphyllina]